jgi:PST family polysaccharide transporter
LTGERQRVARGAVWSAVDFWTQQTSSLLTLIVVGNMIGPTAVGILAMAQFAVSLAMAFVLDGLSDAVVQRQEIRPAHFDTAFWLLLGIGSLAGITLAALSPAIALLFGEPDLTLVLPLLAIGLPFAGITAAYQAIVQRELKFSLLAIRSLISATTGFLVAIGMARLGFGVLSLVGFFVVSRILDAVVLASLSRTHPAGRIERAAAKDIISFGKHRMGNQFIGFFVVQIDRFSVAFFLGPLAAGLYSVAERIAAALNYGVAGVMQRVAFPVLSSRQNENVAFERALKDFLLAANVVTMPVFAGLALTSSEIFALLFTEQWSEGAKILAILSLAALPLATKVVLTAGINARGRPDIAMRYSTVILVLRVVASLIAAQFGLEAVAWANLAVTGGSTFIVIYGVRPHVPVSVVGLAQGLWAPAVAVTVMAAATWFVDQIVTGQPVAVVLATKVAVGAAVYGLVLCLVAPRMIMRELPRLIGTRTEPKPR